MSKDPDDELDFDCIYDEGDLMNLPTGGPYVQNGVWGLGPGWTDIPISAPKKACTCGAESVYGEDTPHHSYWCEKYEEN